MSPTDLFHGIAVVIDDEINSTSTRIGQIKQLIEAQGCPVIGFPDLPSSQQLKNLRNASFFIVDWNLIGIPPETGANVSSTLLEQRREDVIGFLRDLKNVRCAPVFIFTDEPLIAEIEAKLAESNLFDKNDRSHILVKSKAEVVNGQGGVFPVLHNWLSNAPAAYVLRRWETEYETAKNSLFLDFSLKTSEWPLIAWNAFKEDSVDPSVGLGELISRNLASRMTPFDFELDPLAKDSTEVNLDRDTLLAVLEGDRFLRKERLHENSIAPGDVFSSNGTNYLINIRPTCDCIRRTGSGSNDDLELYLLIAKPEDIVVPDVEHFQKFGLSEQNNEAKIFPVLGKVLTVKFKDVQIKKWKHLKDQRLGRILPPYLTHVQQKYAAYLQRPGLAHIPIEVLPPNERTRSAASAPSCEIEPAEDGKAVPVPAVLVEAAAVVPPQSSIRTDTSVEPTMEASPERPEPPTSPPRSI